MDEVRSGGTAPGRRPGGTGDVRAAGAPAGLVLAAGAGRRAGGPKALRVAGGDTPWLRLAVDRLLGAGCARVVVVLGASADAARPLVPADAEVVVAEDWPLGASAALRAGLVALEGGDAPAVLITLVDLPDATPEAGRRLLDRGGTALRSALCRAVHDGMPGHPVLVGRDHWKDLVGGLEGDAGANAYLRAHGAIEVDCSDLEDGRDEDGPGTTAH